MANFKLLAMTKNEILIFILGWVVLVCGACFQKYRMRYLQRRKTKLVFPSRLKKICRVPIMQLIGAMPAISCV